MAEARDPSTRRLYALKWSVFSACCQDRDIDPVTSDVSMVLSFLQEMLDKQRSSSTNKVYAVAIAAFHAPIAGQSVGRDSAVVQFLRGTRRMNPPRPHTVPPWDLPTILRAPPFEPLNRVSRPQLCLAEQNRLFCCLIIQTGVSYLITVMHYLNYERTGLFCKQYYRLLHWYSRYFPAANQNQNQGSVS